jgi:hypothetical protein
MPVTDLATLAQAKAWIPNAPAASDDALIASLITASSISILSVLQRPTVLSRPYTDYFDGYGEYRKMLRNYPVTSISSLLVDATTIPVSPGMGSPGATSGYVLQAWDGSLPGDPQMLDLRGYVYCWGRQNVRVIYQAGYLVSAEPMTVPSGGGAVTAAQLNGPWAEDAGVVYAVGGVSLAKVTDAPGTGQYSVVAGVYTFALGDAGKGVLASYSYVPAPLNQACIEMTAEAYRYRTRIGEKSHTVPGAQTVAFDTSRLTSAIKMMIEPFKMVVPIL